jgi:hypothetical protein
VSALMPGAGQGQHQLGGVGGRGHQGVQLGPGGQPHGGEPEAVGQVPPVAGPAAAHHPAPPALPPLLPPPPHTLDTVQSTFLPRSTVMVHCYSVLDWLCRHPALARPPGPVYPPAGSTQAGGRGQAGDIFSQAVAPEDSYLEDSFCVAGSQVEYRPDDTLEMLERRAERPPPPARARKRILVRPQEDTLQLTQQPQSVSLLAPEPLGKGLIL